MSRFLEPSADYDRCLIVDDTDDDVTQLLTVICESSGSRRPRPETFEPGDLA